MISYLSRKSDLNMKKVVAILTISILLISCKQSNEWKTIEIGNYLFNFPPDFELVKENGIDSYVGKIKGDSIEFSFDFGYYSNDFEDTEQEFLENGHWKMRLMDPFYHVDSTYDSNSPGAEVLKIRKATIQDSSLKKGCDYVASCRYLQTEFEYGIVIPTEIKQTEFTIDTIDNQYRKIVSGKTPPYSTGIYIKDLGSFNRTIKNYLALSMSTKNLTQKQKELVLKIYKTGRKKS